MGDSESSQQSGRPFKVDFRFVSRYVTLCDPRNGRKVAYVNLLRNIYIFFPQALSHSNLIDL